MTSVGEIGGTLRDQPARLLLGVLGIALIVAGFALPGTETKAVNVTVVLGVGVACVSLLLPRLSEFELGPKGFRTKLNPEAASGLTLDGDAGELTRFAALVSGDPATGRDLVEEAVARTTRQRRGAKSEARTALILQTLLQLLETAKARQWLRVPRTLSTSPSGELPEVDPDISEALSGLPFHSRVAFLLTAEWLMNPGEIASLLQRSPEQVHADLERAYATLGPLFDSSSEAASGQ